MKYISLLGATGSIGEQTLDVISQHPDKFQLKAMTFGRNIAKAIPIIERFQPEFVGCVDEETYHTLKNHSFAYDVKLAAGDEANIEAATYDAVDVVVNALVGSVGLVPTLKAIEQKRQLHSQIRKHL